MKLTISKGNNKLGVIPNFSLTPVKTCIGNITDCKNYCYAIRTVKLRPNVKKLYADNYQLSQLDNFSDLMIADLKKLFSKKSISYNVFRLFASGDFYSQEFLEKIYKVVKYFPNIKFLAFTRSKLDFTKKPDNLIIRFSMDRVNKVNQENTLKAILDYEYHLIDLKYKVKNLIKHLDGNMCLSLKQCDSCLYCWNTKKNVYFPLNQGKTFIKKLKIKLN